MKGDLSRLVRQALERPHRLGMIGGDLDDQLRHCDGFAAVITGVFGAMGPARAVDLGTGGGVPGVPLAARWPDCQWTLIDARRGRIDEVERVVVALELHSVTVRAESAQQLGHDPAWREQADLVVARSFGPPSTTAECASGLVKVGGVVVVSDPPSGPSDRWSSDGLVALGLAATVESVDEAGAHFTLLRKIRPLPADLPRLPPRPRDWVRSTTP